MDNKEMEDDYEELIKSFSKGKIVISEPEEKLDESPILVPQKKEIPKEVIDEATSILKSSIKEKVEQIKENMIEIDKSEKIIQEIVDKILFKRGICDKCKEKIEDLKIICDPCAKKLIF